MLGEAVAERVQTVEVATEGVSQALAAAGQDGVCAVDGLQDELAGASSSGLPAHQQEAVFDPDAQAVQVAVPARAGDAVGADGFVPGLGQGCRLDALAEVGGLVVAAGHQDSAWP